MKMHNYMLTTLFTLSIVAPKLLMGDATDDAIHNAKKAIDTLVQEKNNHNLAHTAAYMYYAIMGVDANIAMRNAALAGNNKLAFEVAMYEFAPMKSYVRGIMKGTGSDEIISALKALERLEVEHMRNIWVALYQYLMNQWTDMKAPFDVIPEKLYRSGLSFKKIVDELFKGSSLFNVEEMRAEMIALEKELADAKAAGKEL